MTDRYQLENVPCDPELEPKLEAMEAAAELDIAQRAADDAVVSFRWGREQVGVVKAAAAARGLPYEAYLRRALFEQAVADLREVGSTAWAPPKKSSTSSREPTSRSR